MQDTISCKMITNLVPKLKHLGWTKRLLILHNNWNSYLDCPWRYQFSVKNPTIDSVIMAVNSILVFPIWSCLIRALESSTYILLLWTTWITAIFKPHFWLHSRNNLVRGEERKGLITKDVVGNWVHAKTPGIN